MGENIEELNRTIMAALVKKYGSEAAAKEAFRTLDGGELMRIRKEMGFAGGGGVSSAPKLDIDKAIKNVGAENIAPVVHGVYHMESSSGKADTSKPNYAGARGPMQVLRSTFKQMQDEGYIPKNYKWANPQHSLEAGVAYLKYLSDRFSSTNYRVLGAGFYGGPSAVKDPAKAIVADERGDPKNPNAPKIGGYISKLEGYLSKNAPDYMQQFKPKSEPTPAKPVPYTPAPVKKHWWEQNSDIMPIPITSTDAPPQSAEQDITMPEDYSPGGRERLI